jgi:hypothetical protein
VTDANRKPPLDLSPEHLSLLRAKHPWQVRSANFIDDGRLLEAWIAAEPDHAGRTTAEAWLAPHAGVQNLLAADPEGPIVFARLSNAMRVDLQIAPHVEERAAAALRTGLPWLAGMLRLQGYREIIGQTGGRALAAFLLRMHFKRSEGEYVFPL